MSTNKKDEQLSQTTVKCRFFAQYWKQNVLRENRQGFKFALDTVGTQDNELVCFTDSYLQLKSLSNITNEDAIKVAEIFGMKDEHLFVGKFLCNGIFDNSADCEENVLFNSNAKAVDYLRSKGYAVPFMEYSINDLISFGWVRLV